MLFTGRGGNCGIKSSGAGERIPVREGSGRGGIVGVEVGSSDVFCGDDGVCGMFATLVCDEPYVTTAGASPNGAGGRGGDSLTLAWNKTCAFVIKSSINVSYHSKIRLVIGAC